MAALDDDAETATFHDLADLEWRDVAVHLGHARAHVGIERVVEVAKQDLPVGRLRHGGGFDREAALVDEALRPFHEAHDSVLGHGSCRLRGRLIVCVNTSSSSFWRLRPSLRRNSRRLSSTARRCRSGRCGARSARHRRGRRAGSSPFPAAHHDGKHAGGYRVPGRRLCERSR